METREALHNDLTNSLEIIKQEYKLLNKILGEKFNNSLENKKLSNHKNLSHIDNGLIEYYGPKNPETILVAMGSIVGTIQETIKNFKNVGLLKIKVYRPFPNEEILKIIKLTKNIAVLEKAISLGQGGPLYLDIAASINSSKEIIKNKNNFNLKNYIVGLGGRDVNQKMLINIIKDAPKKNNYLKFIS